MGYQSNQFNGLAAEGRIYQGSDKGWLRHIQLQKARMEPTGSPWQGQALP